MRPIRKLAIGLWVAVFLVAGIRVGAGWRPWSGEPTADSAVNSGVDSTDKLKKGPESATSRPAIGPGGRLPAIALKDLRGEPRTLAEWPGRTLLINFWATWCAPCRKEMPLLEQFQRSQDPATLQVVGIAIDRLDPVLRFVGETGVTYPNLVGEMDATRAAEQFVPGFALPLTVVAAPDGTVLAVQMGELRASDLARVADVAAGLAAGTLTPAAAITRLAPGSTP